MRRDVLGRVQMQRLPFARQELRFWRRWHHVFTGSEPERGEGCLVADSAAAGVRFLDRGEGGRERAGYAIDAAFGADQEVEEGALVDAGMERCERGELDVG